MKKIKHNIKNVFYLMKPYWQYGKLYIIVSVFMSIFIGPLANILNVYFHKTVLDSIMDGNPFIKIILIIAFFEIATFVLPMIQQIIEMLYLGIQRDKISMKINRDVFIKAIKTDYKYFDNSEFYHNYTMTLNQYNSQSMGACIFMMQFMTSFATIAAMLSIIALTDPLIIAFTIITLFVSTVINNISNKIWVKRHDESIKQDRRLWYIQRIFYMKEYAADMKSNNAKDYLFENYDDTLNKKINVAKKYTLKLMGIGSLQSFIRNGLNFIIVAYVAYKIVSGEITIGSFAAMITASASLQGSLGMFFNFFTQVNQMSIYADKMKEFLELKSEIEDPPVINTIPEQIKDGPFDIEMKDVSFTYDHSNFSMNDINIKINKGDKIAIVGENGGGKSTLTKLLLRLYDVDSGDILINGVSIKKYDVNELRRNIGIAFQHTMLYAMTLSENIQVYYKKPDSELIEIAEKLGLKHVLEKSSDGLGTQVTKEFDNDGILLSGGETQKLGLARIFTGEFGLILLDEPSSALDPLAEYKLNKIIFDRQSTTTAIIISHRLSTVRDADCIYLIDNGTVTEYGTHEQLMENKSKYYDMFTKQAENYIK